MISQLLLLTRLVFHCNQLFIKRYALVRLLEPESSYASRLHRGRALGGAGFRRTTVAALCRAAGIAKGSFYRYFEDKAQLVEALFEPLRERAARRGAATGLPDHPEKIRPRLPDLRSSHSRNAIGRTGYGSVRW